MPSQQQSSLTPAEIRDSWRTPPFVFHYLNQFFKFDVDLAASKENTLVPMMYFSEKFNALNYDWHRVGKTGWLNPPYSDQSPWVEKALREASKGFTTVMLLPCFNGQDWWRPILYYGKVYPIIGRLGFLAGADFEKNGKLIKEGQEVPGNSAGSCVVVFGDDKPLDGCSYLDRNIMKTWWEEQLCPS